MNRMNIKDFFSKKANNSYEESINESLGFTQKDCSTMPTSAIENNANKFIIKNNNVDTYISSYSQNDINAGIIFGLPSNLDPYFKHSIKLANSFFNKKDSIFQEETIYSQDILFIKPFVYTETDSQTGRTAFLLPSIFTVATFDKFDESNYTLRVAWWQNDYGIPEKKIIEQLEKVEWKKPYVYTWDL